MFTTTTGYDNSDDATRQWDLFLEHHARGLWRGNWKTYDNMGDIIDSRPAIVVLQPDRTDPNVINHRHEIRTLTTSDIANRFGADEFKSFPVASYQKGDLKSHRCISQGMVCGPRLLRSGAMSTELILADREERVRVSFQHIPTWPKGLEPNTCPPDGLKLYRTIVSCESLNDHEGDDFVGGNGLAAPFIWDAKWSGTSWTWSPNMSDQECAIEELEEVDAWHGRQTSDNPNIWSIRLSGGLLIQCPREVYREDLGAFRLAWLRPSLGRLLRIEGGVMALEERERIQDNDIVGFHPPCLKSLRCDVLLKVGELKKGSILEKQSIIKQKTDTDNVDDGNDNDELEYIRKKLKL